MTKLKFKNSTKLSDLISEIEMQVWRFEDDDPQWRQYYNLGLRFEDELYDDVYNNDDCEVEFTDDEIRILEEVTTIVDGRIDCKVFEIIE